jgi:hypothetical protein
VKAIKSFIARHWLAAFAGLIGYAFVGITGMILGFSFGMLIGPALRLFRRRHECQLDYQKITTRYGKSADLAGRVRPASMKMFCAFLVISVLLPLYGAFVGVAHDSRIFGDWMGMLQPAVNWLTPFIPAFQRMTLDLAASGHADWAPAVQHILFVGWSISLAMTAWIVLDVIFNGRTWAQLPFLSGHFEGIKSCLSFLAFLGLSLLFLFFGMMPRPDRNSFELVLRMPILAFFFVFMILLFFALVQTCNALLWRSRSRSRQNAADEQSRAMRREMEDMLRRTLHGKSE